ncbi:MAG: carbamoyl-phosphate-synthetase [Acidimicrobiales bacterium]
MVEGGGTRVLLSEGSSLTAREFVSVLGPLGYHLEVVDPRPACLLRWSRWVRKVHPAPPSGADPVGYLAVVDRVLRDRRIDVLLPTHEQAWLFAAARERIHPAIGLAVAPAGAFGSVQSKIDFARLLDDLGIPQPAWCQVPSASDLPDWPFPYYLKVPFSTAGRGVRLALDGPEAVARFAELSAMAGGTPIMAQQPATGRYAQVQAVARRGDVVAVHTSAQTAVGMGDSAAGRVSVDHGPPRRHVAEICRRLTWHGGITLDYFFAGDSVFDCGAVRYLECNPRTVEPANAARSGVDLPGTHIALSLGRAVAPAGPVRAGVRTHSTMAVLLGTADRTGSRRRVLADLVGLALHRRAFAGSIERLTPVVHDPPSLVPLMAVTLQLLADPGAAARLSTSTVTAYSVTEEAIAKVSGAPGPGP